MNSRRKNGMSVGLWPQPRRRNVGVFSDLTLYVEALDLARQRDGITASLLIEELKPRVRALRLVREQSTSVARSLVDELQLFGWLQAPATAAGQRGAVRARLTADGQAALERAQADRRGFLRLLVGRHN
jgi:hypothetical protein